MEKYYAKSIQKNEKEAETIKEHTLKLFDEFKFFKNRLKNFKIEEELWQLAHLACFIHDLGKYNDKFQEKIRKGIFYIDGEIPHCYLSTAFIPQIKLVKLNNNFFPLFYAVAYHHDRIINFNEKQFKSIVNNDLSSKKLLLGWLKEYDIVIDEKLWDSAYSYFDKNSQQYLNLFLEKTEEQRENKKKYIYIKGILHKCDYAASAGIPAEVEYKGNFVKDFENNLPFNKEKLTDQQKKARCLSDKSIIFLASTGAGKTEYSMNWINGDKAFYLLGLRTAVDAMYERFKKIFAFDEEHKNNVSLLHGESIYRLLDDDSKKIQKNEEEDDSDIFKKYNSIRQISSPITVATADQLVPSVFKFPGFEFFYFTASYSKIIIDEVQSFSPEAIASIVVFLQEVHKLGAKFLLMTATLPPFVRDELIEQIPSESIEEDFYFSQEKRHVIELAEENLFQERAYEIIKNGLKNNKKILVILNTVAGAQRLYDRLKEFKPEVLHSRFTREHRSEKEKLIMNETKDKDKMGKACLWISTQIVEASLDIDFDILLTENATIDALLQRFGRCWRRREYDSSVPNIYIFEPEKVNITNLIYDSEITARTWNVLKRYNKTLITEEMKQNIIEHVFNDIRGTGYYEKYDKIKKLLILGLRTENKSEAQEYFRKINNNYLVIPESIYKKHKTEIENSYNKTQNKSIDKKERFKAKRNILNFTMPVQVFGERKKLLGEIYVDEKSLTGKLDIWCLKGVEYSPEKGAEFSKDNKNYKDLINNII